MPNDTMTVRRTTSAPLGNPLYMLSIFALTQVMLGIDRGILSILAEPIRKEFHLTDTQVGLLIGISFAVFFSVAGLLLGYVIDRWNRRNILAACVAIFSASTLMAGFSSTFVHLWASRLLVGAGEGGGGPAMISMISDRFPAERRATAISIYYSGLNIGTIINFLGGAYIAVNYGWRVAFFFAGIPGIILMLLIFLTIKEPPRVGVTAVNAPSLKETVHFILSQRTLLHVLAAAIFLSAPAAAIGSFGSSFLIRVHGLTLQQAGLVMALALGVAGFCGATAGGLVNDRLAKVDLRWRSWALGTAMVLIACSNLMALNAPYTAVTIGCMTIGAFLSSSMYGPVIALTQSLVQPRMRGAIAAVYYFNGNLVGAAGGSAMAGILSDVFKPRFGELSLRYALSIVVLLELWSAVHLFLSSKTLRKDVEKAAAMA